MKKLEQNTQAQPPSLAAPVSAGAESPQAIEAPAHSDYRKVTAKVDNFPNFNTAPAGLRPIGGVLAGIIAGLPVPRE